MSIEIMAFENFVFLQDGRNSYEFTTSEICLDEFFTFGDYFEAEETAKKLNLLDAFKRIIPYIQEIQFFPSEEEKKELEKKLVDPNLCLEINKETGLIQSLIIENPESRIVAMSFCEPRSCIGRLSS